MALSEVENLPWSGKDLCNVVWMTNFILLNSMLMTPSPIWGRHGELVAKAIINWVCICILFKKLILRVWFPDLFIYLLRKVIKTRGNNPHNPCCQFHGKPIVCKDNYSIIEVIIKTGDIFRNLTMKSLCDQRQVLMLLFEQWDRLIVANKSIYTGKYKKEKGDCKLKEINNKSLQNNLR